MEPKDRLLIIFVRNPIPGKVKTRLAAHIGPAAALNIYLHLMQYTAQVTAGIEAVLEVHYSEEIPSQDLWDGTSRKLQRGKDLGERMKNAFLRGFEEGFRKIVLIGSDIPDLQQEDIEAAFSALDQRDYVLGPAGDGGYYLIGMKSLNSKVFQEKAWGSDEVLRETLKDLEPYPVSLLQERNDLDTYEDLKGYPQFQEYLKK